MGGTVSAAPEHSHSLSVRYGGGVGHVEANCWKKNPRMEQEHGTRMLAWPHASKG